MAPKDAVLPVRAEAARLGAALTESRRLVLTAPPGTGKSTQLPLLLAEHPALEGRRVAVLEPRRLAARALARRVAFEHGSALGDAVGYAVRFDSRQGPETRIVYYTYGVFWNLLLSRAPELEGIGAIVLDEFHERALDMDACLAAIASAQAERPHWRVILTSATLPERERWEATFPGAVWIALDAPMFPVERIFLPARDREGPLDHAARGVRHALEAAPEGSVLAFLPGVGEIRALAERLAPELEREGVTVLPLYGALDPAEQDRALGLPETRRCVVLATNVAETSLTIPGVRAVVDSGTARLTRFDAASDRDALRLERIAQANATQRQGRAGRLGPGVCVKLWAAREDAALAAAIDPEIRRVDLTRLRLEAASYPGRLHWLEPPPGGPWRLAEERLAVLGALDAEGALLPHGRALLRLPVHPAFGAALVRAGTAGVGRSAAAAAAIAETEALERLPWGGDAAALAAALAGGRERGLLGVETRRVYQALARGLPPDGAPEPARALYEAFRLPFSHRLASRDGAAYALPDGRKAFLPAAAAEGQEAPAWLLALALTETRRAGGAPRLQIALHLPVEAAWLDEAEATTLEYRWDAARSRIVPERVSRRQGRVTASAPAPAAEWDRAEIERLLVERLLSGASALPGLAEDGPARQLVARSRWGARVAPEHALPAFSPEDWEVLYRELVGGLTSPLDVSEEKLMSELRAYVGAPGLAWLDFALPVKVALPNGRRATVTYFEDETPPEVSARLGDFIGYGGLRLAEGKVPVVYDILAPNHRTVQKTRDLAGFWTGSYPEIKKELKRRYPKHPWP